MTEKFQIQRYRSAADIIIYVKKHLNWNAHIFHAHARLSYLAYKTPHDVMFPASSLSSRIWVVVQRVAAL